MHLYPFDQLVLGVMLINGLIGLWQGFGKQLIAVCVIPAAFAAAVYVSLDPQSAGAVAPAASQPTTSFAMVFLGVYLAGMLLSAAIHLSGVLAPGGFLSRLGGFALGAGSGLLIVTIFFIANAAGYQVARENVVPPFNRAATYPLIRAVGTVLIDVGAQWLPEDLAKPVSRVKL